MSSASTKMPYLDRETSLRLGKCQGILIAFYFHMVKLRAGNEIDDPDWIGLCLFIPRSLRHSEKQT